MNLNEKQKELLEFVKLKHKDQKRKYTNEPYVNHLINVAELVRNCNYSSIEIALCHDLIEDTDCTIKELLSALHLIGYSETMVLFICNCVFELTDVYTCEAYPELNRAIRKEKEANRLGGISIASQTVKYADLIDNSISICEYDKDFAKVYLKEKEQILNKMTQGDSVLFSIAKYLLKTFKNRLEII